MSQQPAGTQLVRATAAGLRLASGCLADRAHGPLPAGAWLDVASPIAPAAARPPVPRRLPHLGVRCGAEAHQERPVLRERR